MSLHKIEKQKLFHEPLSEDALRLARAIYNTYIKNEQELFMEIKISTVLNFLNLHPSKDSIVYIKNLFEELNEPICVNNFKFYANVYPLRFIVFCSYIIKEETIEIELSEEFLYAENEYMLDPFLKG